MAVKSEGGGMADALAAEIEAREAELAVLKELHHEQVDLDERIKGALNGHAPQPPAAPATRAPRGRGAKRKGGKPKAGKKPDPQSGRGAATTPPPPSGAGETSGAPSGRPTTTSAASSSKPSRRTMANQRALDVLELLKRQGSMSQAEIAATTGFARPAVYGALDKLASAKPPVARKTGEERRPPGVKVGRPSPVWEAIAGSGDASPEPGAGVATTDAAPAEVVQPDVEELHDDNDEDLVVDGSGVAATPEEPPAPDVSIEDITPPPRQATVGLNRESEELRGEVDAYLLEHGPSSLKQIHEALQLADRGMSAHAFGAAMINNPWAESWGHDAESGKATWRRVPKPAEREGLTVRQADRSGTVQGRVLECLGERGELTVEELATHLVLPRRLVGEACTALARSDAVVKGPGGKYDLAGSVAA